MRKLISILLIFISLNGISQTTKEDSLLITETNAYVDSISKKIPLTQLREWTYKNASAEKYDMFMSIYNAFLQEKGLLYFNTKKKKPR